MEAAVEPLLLSLRGLSKRYEQVLALDNVDLDLHVGRCHALVGENGAGKSTLIKTIGGFVRPDRGQITIAGATTALSSPSEALRQGISVVPQELVFAPNLSVAENISLGELDSKASVVRSRAVRAKAQELLSRLGAEIDVTKPLGELGPAIQQLAMIARALARDVKLLVLDEPTASLSAHETGRLFTALDELKAAGIGLLYVSHRLAELRRLAEDVTVLRDGARVASWSGVGVPDEDQLVEAMVGRPLQRTFHMTRQRPATGRELLRVEGLNRRGVLEDISFSVAQGEVLAITGLMGAGRTEVLRCVAGCDRPDAMAVAVNGRPVKIRKPSDAQQAGLMLLPEERQTQGLVGAMSVADNVSLPYLKRWSTAWLVRDRARRADVSEVAGRVGLQTWRYKAPANTLSGGNQQKVVLAKALLGNPPVILLDEPTRGIDVATKQDIHALIGNLADSGCAVVLVSSDMPEVLALADRILVLRAGRIAGTLDAQDATERSILQLSLPDMSLIESSDDKRMPTSPKAVHAHDQN